MKVDGEGTPLWQKHLGDFSENAKDIERTGNGEFLILSNVFTGKDLATNEDLYDFKVIKVNAAGDKLDSVVYHKYSSQFMNSVTPLKNGGFFVAGNTSDEDAFQEPALIVPPPDQEDILYVQFTPGFDSLANNQSTSTEHVGAAVKVFEGEAKNYIFIYSDSEYGLPSGANSNHAVFDVFFQNIPWIPAYDLTGTPDKDELLEHVIKDPFTNGYFEFGTSLDLPETAGALFFAKRTGSFDIIDQGVIAGFSGNYAAVSVAPCTQSEEGYLLLANETLIAGSNIRLIKVNQACSVQWSASFGSISNQSAGAAVAELPDGRVLVLGTIELETQKKIALMKVNSQGKFSD
jgi:hypothetical protein